MTDTSSGDSSRSACVSFLLGEMGEAAHLPKTGSLPLGRQTSSATSSETISGSRGASPPFIRRVALKSVRAAEGTSSGNRSKAHVASKLPQSESLTVFRTGNDAPGSARQGTRHQRMRAVDQGRPRPVARSAPSLAQPCLITVSSALKPVHEDPVSGGETEMRRLTMERARNVDRAVVGRSFHRLRHEARGELGDLVQTNQTVFRREHDGDDLLVVGDQRPHRAAPVVGGTEGDGGALLGQRCEVYLSVLEIVEEALSALLRHQRPCQPPVSDAVRLALEVRRKCEAFQATVPGDEGAPRAL